VDVYSKRKRSRIMALIGGKNTGPELAVRRFLHSKGFRYRLHAADLPGKPDIVFPKYGAVVFVHGCFWHGHRGCRKGRTLPATRKAFWRRKIEGNRARDRRDRRRLRRMDWRVFVVWACRIRNRRALERLSAAIRSRRTGSEAGRKQGRKKKGS
jgi:DNA mismatch endonuclease (patch repair protein)